MRSVDIVFPEACELYVDLQCNNSVKDYTDCAEVQPFMDRLSKLCPQNVLEIGAGIGRVSVYLRNALAWCDTHFWLMDGDTGTEQVAGISYELKDDFYNSFVATNAFCTANNISEERLTLIDAAKDEWPQVKFDLCYSFKAIGFHWPINEYLLRVYPYMKKGALL